LRVFAEITPMRALRNGVLLVVFLLVAAMAFFLLTPGDQDLLRTANPVPAIRNPKQDYYAVLDGCTAITAAGYSLTPDWWKTLERLDIRSGGREPLTKAVDRLSSIAANGPDILLRPSADGQRILVNFGYRGARFRGGMVSLDGSQADIFGPTPYTSDSPPIHWAPDGHRWLFLHRPSEEEAVLRDADTPGWESRIALPRDRPVGNIAGLTREGKLLFWQWDDKLPNGRARLHTVDLNVNPTTAHTTELNAPPGSDLGFIMLSPSGDRLCWWVMKRHPLSGPEWLQKARRMIGARPYWEHQVWVSRVDGSGLRLLGRVDTYAEATALYDFDRLAWWADGKGLSFLYKGGLYMLPVEDRP
jgi:hypothetical protein